MKKNNKTKNGKITNLTLSLGMVTTIAGTIATSIGVSESNSIDERSVVHDLSSELQISSSNSKILPSDTQLSKLGITTICEDGKGGFYVGGKNGLFEHFDSDGELSQSKDSKDKITFDITSITLNKNNQVLISGSNAAHVVMDSKGNILESLNLNNAFKIQGAVSKSFSSKNGQTYIIGTHGLVSIFDINGVELKTLNLGQGVNVNAMIETDDSIVLGTEQGGLFFINKITNKVSSTQVNSPVVSIQTNKGGVFVQTQTKSLEVSNNNEILNSQDLNIFKNAKVTNIVSTEKGYIATGTDGYVALLDKSFKVISQSIALQGKDISSIVKDDESGFYIAGKNGLVSHVDAKGAENSEEIKTLLDGNDIYGMQRNDEGHIFVFGNSFKVAELDNRGKTIKHFNLLGISSINTATTKADGEIIFGGEIKSTKVWDTRIESETNSESPLVVTGNPSLLSNVSPTSIQQANNHQMIESVQYDLKTITTKTIQPYSKFPTFNSNITDGTGAQFLEDSHGNYWSIGTNSRLQFSDDKGTTWNEDLRVGARGTAHSKTLFEDSHGIIWIMGPTSGIEKFEYDSATSNTGTWVEQTKSNSDSEITEGAFGNFFQDSNDVLWALAPTNLPQKYDYSTEKWTSLDPTCNLQIGVATPNIHEDSQGTFWYSADSVPFQKSFDRGETWVNANIAIPNTYGNLFFEDSNGTLWASGYNTPLKKSIDGARTWIAAGTNNIITSGSFGSMIEDSQGTLWVMGMSCGLQKSIDGGENWINEKTTEKSNITNGYGGKIFEDSTGQLWSMGAGTPLQKYDYNKKEWSPQTALNSGSNIINGNECLIYEDSQHNLWTAGSGTPLQVKPFNSKRWDTKLVGADIPPTTKITDSAGGSIFEDSKNRMWMMGANATLEMSMDKGVTWTQSKGADVAGTGYIFENKTSKDLYAIVTAPRAAVAASAGVAAVTASKSIVFKLEDGKTDWAEDSSFTATANGGYSIQDHNGWIWIIANGTKPWYLEPGKPWVESTSSVVGGVGPSIFEDHNNEIWIIGKTTCQSTTDSGVTWKTPNWCQDYTPGIYASNGANAAMSELKSGQKWNFWVSYGGGSVTWHSVDGSLPAVTYEPFYKVYKDTYGYFYLFSNAGIKITKEPNPNPGALPKNQWNWFTDPNPWVSPSPSLVSEKTSQKRDFLEDSKGVIWITNSHGVQFSDDKGSTWKNSVFKVTSASDAHLFEDSDNKIWLFTKDMPPQFINPTMATAKTMTSNKEIKGSVQVNAFMNDFKIHLGFTGLKKLENIGIFAEYKSPSGTWNRIRKETLGINEFGKYDFKFILDKTINSGLSNKDLPNSFSATFKDGDGIDKVHIDTLQPKTVNAKGTFEVPAFINTLHSALQMSSDGGHTWTYVPETGYSELASVGATRQYRYELDPNYGWTNKPANPPTETILRVGVGKLEQEAPGEIEKQIKSWMATPFDFSKWTKLSFVNGCKDAKQQVTVTSSDTKVDATFDISLIPTTDNKFHYEVTGLTINNGVPVPETSLPLVFARLKALTHEFTISPGKFESIVNIVKPVLAKEFAVEKGKLPSTVINAKTGASAGKFHYTDPNGVFTIDFTPNNEEGKIHWSALETGAKTPIEGDIAGFYSYDLMTQKVVDADIVKKAEAALATTDLTKYTKELFNSSVNKSKNTFSVTYTDPNSYYTWELEVTLKGVDKDKIDCQVTSFDVKEGKTNLADSLTSSKFKTLESKVIPMTLTKPKVFTTFSEIVEKVFKTDSTKIASTAVQGISGITKGGVLGTYEFSPSADYKITFTPDNAGQKVNWKVVAMKDPRVIGTGSITGFEKYIQVTAAQLRKELLSKANWYHLDKLPSDSSQPKDGDVCTVLGMNIKIKVVPSDYLGEFAISGEYTDQLGNDITIDPIKLFGFKDLASEITSSDIQTAIEAKLADKSKGIFDRATDKLPSEVYINKGGYEIKVLVHYSFVDTKINYEAFLPNGNSVQNTLQSKTNSLSGYTSESEQKIWDPTGITKLEDSLGEVIKDKLKTLGENHNKLPSDVKTKFSKIDMERGFDFEYGNVQSLFSGYKSMKINDNYSIIYNSSKDLQVVDTTTGNIWGAPIVIGGNGTLINAFSYGSQYMVLIEGGTSGNTANVQFVNLRTTNVESEQSFAAPSKSIINSIQEVSQGKFIYKDAKGELRFLLLDPDSDSLIADEKAIINAPSQQDNNNLRVADLSTINPLKDGGFIVAANGKLYNFKIDGVTIKVNNKTSISTGVQIKQIGMNEFLIKDGQKIYVSEYKPGTGFDNSKAVVSKVNFNLSQSIRINDEYVIVKNAGTIYKINVNTNEVESLDAMIIPALKPLATSGVFINIGNRGILYSTNTATGIARVLTDGFYEATMETPVIDNSQGTITFKVNFLGKTISYTDGGYLKEIIAPSSEILNHIDVTGDASSLKIDESALPKSISDHAHLEYSLDNTKWQTADDLLTYLRMNNNAKIVDLEAKYVPDNGYAIKNIKAIKVFEGITTLDNSNEHILLEQLVKKSYIQGSVIKAQLTGVNKELFSSALLAKKMKLMINVDKTGWRDFDISASDETIPQIFDKNGDEVKNGLGINSFDELYDSSKMSLSFKMVPLDPKTRLNSQSAVDADLSHLKVLIHTTITDLKTAQSNVKVTGESGGLKFDSSKAIDKTKPGNKDIIVKYSLTGGKNPTEDMLKEIFGLQKGFSPSRMQNLMQIFTKYNWFTEAEYKNNIEDKLKGLNINANSILAKFDSDLPNTELETQFTAPFKTSGIIIVYHDVSELKNKIIDLKDGIVKSGGLFQVQLPKELLPIVLAQYGMSLKTRDGDKTIIDGSFGMVLQYSMKANPSPSDWKTIEALKGNTFIIPKSGGLQQLQMRLKPINVQDGVVLDWKNIGISLDRTLISDPAKPRVQPTTGVNISLRNVKIIKEIKVDPDVHFNLEGGADSIKEPKMPTYRFIGEENGAITINIKKNDLPATTDVFVQWLRPTKDANGVKDGYEMYTGEVNGAPVWVKVANDKDGKLDWTANEYNNQPGSWIDPSDIKGLSVGDHVRFRLHAVGEDDQFLWSDQTVNHLSEMVYSENKDPKNNQADGGVEVEPIIINPNVDQDRITITFVAPNGKDDPKDLSEKMINTLEPNPTAKWMWHYTIYLEDGSVFKEFDNKIPDNILKQGMTIKMKVVSIEPEVYILDKKVPNAFNDKTVEWPIRLNESEFDFKGVSGKGILVTNLPKEIKDAKLIYKVISVDNEVIETTRITPTNLKNGETIKVTVNPLEKNKLLVADQELIIKVNGLTNPVVDEMEKVDVPKPIQKIEEPTKWTTIKPAIEQKKNEPVEVAKTLGNGTKILTDGTIVKKDGTKILLDGTEIKKDGSKILIDGTILDPDGNELKTSKTLSSSFVKILAISSATFVSVLTGGWIFALLRRRRKKDE